MTSSTKIFMYPSLLLQPVLAVFVLLAYLGRVDRSAYRQYIVAGVGLGLLLVVATFRWFPDPRHVFGFVLPVEGLLAVIMLSATALRLTRMALEIGNLGDEASPLRLGKSGRASLVILTALAVSVEGYPGWRVFIWLPPAAIAILIGEIAVGFLILAVARRMEERRFLRAAAIHLVLIAVWTLWYLAGVLGDGISVIETEAVERKAPIPAAVYLAVMVLLMLFQWIGTRIHARSLPTAPRGRQAH